MNDVSILPDPKSSRAFVSLLSKVSIYGRGGPIISIGVTGLAHDESLSALAYVEGQVDGAILRLEDLESSREIDDSSSDGDGAAESSGRHPTESSLFVATTQGR